MIDIINVIELINDELNGIESWSSDNSDRAEYYFQKCCLENNALEEDLEIHTENGYYKAKDRNYKVYISLSNLN